jgi:bifunctional non-homologous end joining protein LigD
LIDWLQNDATRSTVATYSLRAAPYPTVSTPLAWEEVEAGAGYFLAGDVLARLDRLGDLFAPVLELEQRLP